MTLPKKIALNTAFSAVAKVTWTLIALVTVGMITRYLGAAGFGKYTTILSFYFLFAAVGDLGLNQIVLREISLPNAKEREVVSTAFMVKILFSLVLMFAAAAATLFLPYEADVKKGIVLACSGLIFSSGYQVLAGVFQKRLTAFWVSIAEMIGRIANLAWVFGCVALGLSFLWVAGGMVASWAATFIIVFFLAKRTVGFRLTMDLKLAKRLLVEAMPLGLSAIVTFVYFRIDTIILSIVKGPADVGIYGAAYKILENVSYFPAMFMGLMMPLYAQNVFADRQKFRRIADKAFGAISLLAVGLFFGIFSLSSKIIHVIAGPGFEESAGVLRVLDLAIVGIFWGQCFNMILIAANLQKKLLKIFIICAVMNVTLNFLLIPKYSYMAAAWVSSLTELLVSALSVYFVFKHYKYFPNLGPLLKAIPAGIVMSLLLLVLVEWPIYVQIPAGGVVFLALAYLFGAYSQEDIKKVMGIS